MNPSALHSRAGILLCCFLSIGAQIVGVEDTSAEVADNAFSVESASSKAKHSERRSFFHQSLDDGLYLVSQPDFYLVVGGLGAAPFVFRSEFAHESVALNNRWRTSPGADKFFEQGEWTGQASLHVGVSLVSMGIGKLTHSPSLQSFGSDLFRAQGFNGVITLSMKFITDRTRPDGSPYSYPSGHTSTSFASAGVIYSHFGKVWGAAAFLGASYVGLSRIAENKHYLTDVFSGAIIGSYVGLKIAHRSNGARRLSVLPDTQFAHGGLSLRLEL